MELPTINACLNASATVLLVSGLVAIKRGRRDLHERLMYLALLASAAFLACYLYYHFVIVPVKGETRFHYTGWLRTAYLVMLVSHIVLAVVNLPMVIMTFVQARRQNWTRHKAWAKVTFPIWLYVSVTGVLVYLCLYVFNAPAPG
ncbi:MAG: hypothetical protein RL277_1875 [Planctomycetota bacterium]|jgi:uncharacterized membrane protein YozB (DUF420 family)